MVAFKTPRPQHKAVRMSEHEARVLCTAVAISVLHTAPPECCEALLDNVMDRITAAFNIEVTIDFKDGTVHIDGKLAAEKAE